MSGRQTMGASHYQKASITIAASHCTDMPQRQVRCKSRMKAVRLSCILTGKIIQISPRYRSHFKWRLRTPTLLSLTQNGQTSAARTATTVLQAQKRRSAQRTVCSTGLLRWAKGWDNGAVSSPILVDDCLIVYAGEHIYRVNKATGKVEATGDMAGASSFAINGPTYADGILLSVCPMDAFRLSTQKRWNLCGSIRTRLETSQTARLQS